MTPTEKAKTLVHRFEMESMALHRIQREWLEGEIAKLLTDGARRVTIADCETCDRKQVPCKSCQESQRAICYRCNGDVDDPYCEIDGAIDSGISTVEMTTAQKIARDIRLGTFPRKSSND